MGDYAGIGFVFSKADEFCGIDLDGCIDPLTKKFSPWAKDILKSLASYSEVSPSGTGVKIFIRGKSPFERGRKIAVKQPKCCDKEPAIEIYDFGRYFAVTGQRVASMSPEVEDRQAELAEIAKEYFPDEPKGAVGKPNPDWHSNDAIVERARKYMAKVPPAVSGAGGHNAAFKAACVLVLGFGLSDLDAGQLLSEWNQTCQPPWSEAELKHKLDDAKKATGERNYLRNIAPSNWSEVKMPVHTTKPSPPEKPTRREPTVETLESATRRYIECVKQGIGKAVPLGIPSLDVAVGGGVEYGEMVIMAARPSHGKSAIALQMVHHANANNMPALFISEEMAAMALGKRVVHFATDIPSSIWHSEIGEVEAAVDAHFQKRAKCYVAERCASAEMAAETAMTFVKEHAVKFIVIDYLQLLEGRGKDRYSQVSNASVVIRQLANESKAIVIALCQLNRAIETRSAFLPKVSDLRETGQLEQDADVIVGLVWPWKIDSTQDKGKYQFFVLKNRNRPIERELAECVFEPNRQTVSDPNPFEMVIYDKHGKQKQGSFESFAANGDW